MTEQGVPLSEFPVPSRLQILWWNFKHELRMLLGRFLMVVRFPGLVQAAEFDDLVIGQRVEIHVTRFSTRIAVGNRDYYFNRLTGKFEGTGYANRETCQVGRRLKVVK